MKGDEKMKATKRVLSLLLAVTLSMGLAAPAMAYNSEGSQVDEAGNVTGQDKAQEVQSEYDAYGLDDGVEASEHVTQVYATKDSSFTVRIPKTIILSGDGEHEGKYVIQVKGDVDSEQGIKISPRETDIELKNATGKKAPIIAKVEQNGDTKDGADIGKGWTELASGTITASNLTAGSWQGTMVFDITLTNNTAG